MTSASNKKRSIAFRLNGIRILETTHELLIADSPWYSTLFENGCGDVYVSPSDYPSDMLRVWISYHEDRIKFNKFRYADSEGLFDFINFLDKISSMSLIDVIDLVVDEIRNEGNTNVFRQLTNYQEEQAVGTEISIYEKLMLDHFDKTAACPLGLPRLPRRLLTPFSYTFKDEIYILLKIKLFGYTVLKSVNATWFVVDTVSQARIVRMKPRTKLERVAMDLDRKLHCHVEDVSFPSADKEYAFNLKNVTMCYEIAAVADVGAGSVTACSDDDDDDGESSDDEDFTFLMEDDDYDGTRADGGGEYYYTGSALFTKWRGWIKHGWGCMVKYPDDDSRIRPQEERGHGLYVHNEHHCEGDCFRPCVCSCDRDVGEEADFDDHSVDNFLIDQFRCAFHQHKEEILTNLDEELMEFTYCKDCASEVNIMESRSLIPYLHRLFEALTGKSFGGNYAQLCAFFKMIYPYDAACVSVIKTYEDYINLLMPTEQVIQHKDETLKAKIDAYLKAKKY